jgi:tetratricopeptide (TPR) repeat protein
VLERRKRISKKEMKQDTLVTTYYKAYNFVVDNQMRIMIGVGAVALIVVAMVLYSNKKANDNQKAAALLAKIIPTYDAGKYQQAIDGQKTPVVIGLQEIVEKYGGSEQGEDARIFLANSYYFTGKYDEAMENYEDYSGSNPIFKATALAGQADCLEVKKEYEKAADLFKRASAISPSDPSNAEYLLKAGIDLMKVNKNDEAKQLFETIKEEYKTAASSLEVDKYLVQIKS